MRSTAALIAALVLLGACSGDEAALPPRYVPTPASAPSPAEQGCRSSFPDHHVDSLAEAYNDRDLEALTELVTATEIADVVAAAYGGEAPFADVTAWAETGWDAGDRMRSTGYTAFYRSKRGFQIQMIRKSAVLQRHGIDSVSMTLDAKAKGCAIESLGMSGVVVAKDRPCAFYSEFANVEDVTKNRPRACEDGSGDHARKEPAAVWTGSEALIWGGDRGGAFVYRHSAMDGLTFDPATREWSRIPVPSRRPFAPEVGVWTGAELVVFGARTGPNYGAAGAAFDPATSSWRKLDLPYERSGFEGVWTGTEVILWGGPDHGSKLRRRGVAYNPSADTWRTTSPAPVGGRWWHAAAWTGEEMIVWGGTGARTDQADGAAYDPSSDSWRKLAPAPISARQWLPVAWTGSEVVIWGGSSFSSNRADGAAYDPATDTWRKLAPSPLKGRHYHSATWTGSEVVFFGGYNYHRSFRDGAA
ncbi:MAG: hypothetical protein GEU71_16345, partial [Actinobacteria bacterium]|nr:hypothetical protein [Actinomycetota bacterium]